MPYIPTSTEKPAAGTKLEADEAKREAYEERAIREAGTLARFEHG